MRAHSLVLRSDAERRRFIDVRQRLHLVAPSVVGVYLFAGLTGVLTFGWAPLVPVAAGAAIYGLVWLRMPRLDHPEVALMATMLLAELSLAAAIALVPGAHFYVLPVLIMPVALAAAIFPSRVMTFVIGFAAALTVAVAFAFGAHEVTHDPPVLMLPLVVLIIVAVALSALRDLDIATRQSAIVDELTGVLNRAALAPRVAELAHHASRTGARVAIIAADIDRFKAINDTSGHAVGDAVLREVAQRLSRCVEADESIYRYGGEEFLILLAGADVRSAQRTAERMRRAVGERSVAGLDVTMSFGVTASVAGQPFEFEPVFARADAALYEAKVGGRDQVRLAVAPIEEPVAVEHLPTRGAGTPAADESGRARPVRARERRGDAPSPEVDQPAGARGASSAEPPAPRGDEDDGSWLIANALEREHMLDLNARLRGIFVGCAVLAFAGLVATVPWYGWAILPAPLLGAAMYHLVQRHIERWRRPEYVLVAAWLFLQFTIAVGFGSATHAPLFALPMFVLLVPGMGAIFPRRGVIISTAFTAVLIVVSALHADAHSVLANPILVAFPLALLLAIALVGSAVGRSAVSHRNASVVDDLTGLLNRTALHTRIAELGARAELTGQEVAVVIGDVDRFKQINDTYGHATGDRVLEAIAARIRGCLRTFESAYRIGGEEFAILLSGVAAGEAAEVAERLRQALRGEPVNDLRVTMSFGVATLRPDERFSDEQLFARADAALYRAKSGGRDRVCVDAAAESATAVA